MSAVRSGLGATVAILATVLVAPNPAEAQFGGMMAWDSIGILPDSQVVYLQTHSIHPTQGGTLEVWTNVRTYRRRDLWGVPYDRMLLQADYDCGQRRMRFLWINLYRDNWLVKAQKVEEGNDPISATDYSDILYEALCTRPLEDLLQNPP